MHSTLKRIGLLAIIGCMASLPLGGRTLAAGVDPEMLEISEDLVRRFDGDLRANPGDAFQIFQFYLVTNPRAATALTALFLRGREDLAPSIGAAAAVALSGSYVTSEVIAAQIQGIAQHIGNAAPKTSSDTFSTMIAAVPQFDRQIVAGLARGAPTMASVLQSSRDAPKLASADLSSQGALESADPNISYSDGDALIEALFEVDGTTDAGDTITVSESQINTCLSAPCL